MSKYYKTIAGGTVWYDGRITLDGMQIFNPSVAQLEAAGYVEYIEPVPAEPTERELFERQALAEREAHFAQARVLREELAQEDYKVIKCMEAYLTGVELPYDIGTLSAERNAKRVRINELEAYEMPVWVEPESDGEVAKDE